MVDIRKIIAVYGNSGSYKTATSINLAKIIASEINDVSVAVISLDHTKPIIPLMFSDVKTDVSLGKVLSCENLNQDIILEQTCTHKNLSVLGYNSFENHQSYASPTDARIDDFFMQIRHLFNYTIIDCTSDVSYKMTAKTLINSDNVVYLISCDINGLLFSQSQESILLGEQYGYNNYLRYLTISDRFKQDEEAIKNTVSGISDPSRTGRFIPYSKVITELWNQGKSLSPIPDSRYNKAIMDIADKLLEV